MNDQIFQLNNYKIRLNNDSDESNTKKTFMLFYLFSRYFQIKKFKCNHIFMASTKNVETRTENERKKKPLDAIQVSINENAEQRYGNIKIDPNFPTRVKAMMVCWNEEEEELRRIMI